MLYDYLITQFYPKIGMFAAASIMIIVCILCVYFAGMTESKDKPKYKAKYKFKAWFMVSTQVIWLVILIAIPDTNYIKHFYGDVRVMSPAQREAINNQLDKEHIKSQQLFLECLSKGQKQPEVTAFNDTNEVVKTCYKVARVKF